MKILHIADFGKGKYTGISEAVTNLRNSQEEIGHDVRVLLLRNNVKNDNIKFFYYEKNIEFKKFIDIFKPDIVIFHSFYSLKLIKYSLYVLYLKIPYCIQFHGGSSILSMKKSRIKKNIANFIYFNYFVKKSNGLIFLNNFERANSVFNKFTNSYEIIPNGINLKDNQYINKESKNVVNYTFLSRIDLYYKGLDILIEAIKKVYLSEYRYKIKFSFYGPRYNDDIIKMLEPLENFASYYNAVEGVEKQDVFLNTDIYILTSRSEGMPMTVLESLSYGCPCLLTKQTNMSNIIIENNSGWIVDLDVDSIFKMICKSYDDYIYRKQYYFNNSKNSVRKFSWNLIAERSCQYYSKIIKNK